MTLNFEYETDIKLDLDYEALIEKVVEEALDAEGCPYEIELNIILTDNKEIQAINKEYREVDAPTDVLSFPLVDYSSPSDFSHLEEAADDYFNPETGELLLGDIILSVEKVMGQAVEYGHSEERELGFLVAHSMLHLFGYDHMEEDERAVMEEKQKIILDSLGITRD
ncbi:probable rRNA maturation factor [Anaerocolumna jejuensis DSM 15929]|uniref:Endoribonuclease YbeY n=1 Tax=Anaerocolumna jejuensis DSM 15929 TaxID=1121322 RepID=A0A1M6NRB1_9FIRM|nr:rRNA maturation RNase YbeY [Anaerocolumna jejuensis]SHJ98253.1 probable rRNA maturation factor [Anaerocolumna jejuensis DSM 15929]